MEPDAALVGAECRIELNAEATVDLHLPLVINPRDAENDLSFRLANAFDESILKIARVLGYDTSQTLEHFSYGLVKFLFTSITPQDLLKDGLELLINAYQFASPLGDCKKNVLLCPA